MDNRQQGFSLIESVVALLLVTLALFFTLNLTTRQPRAAERLRANEAALRAVEAAIETVRGGSIPLTEGRTRLMAPMAFLPDPDSEGIQVTMDVARSPRVDGLYSVTMEARYLVDDRVRVQRLQTMMWRPR